MGISQKVVTAVTLNCWTPITIPVETFMVCNMWIQNGILWIYKSSKKCGYWLGICHDLTVINQRKRVILHFNHPVTFAFLFHLPYIMHVFIWMSNISEVWEYIFHSYYVLASEDTLFMIQYSAACNGGFVLFLCHKIPSKRAFVQFLIHFFLSLSTEGISRFVMYMMNVQYLIWVSWFSIVYVFIIGTDIQSIGPNSEIWFKTQCPYSIGARQTSVWVSRDTGKWAKLHPCVV